MNKNIEIALNVLYQRDIVTREQLLNEILRVKLVLKNLNDKANHINDKEQIFQLMKKNTEEELGFFPADRDDFFEIFETIKDIDLVDLAIEIYRNDRSGTVVSPIYLNEYINNRIKKLEPKKVLITEAEKHLAGIREIIIDNKYSEIFITTQQKPMALLFELVFGELSNIKIKFESIYTDCLVDEKFDYIYSFPNFGYKPDEINRSFISRESDGIAIQNMLSHLSENGTLDIIVPAKVTFAGMKYGELRSYINNNFNINGIYILPEGTFKPVASIKTYLFNISRQRHDSLEIGKLELRSNEFKLTDNKVISIKEFMAYEDWRVELLLAEDNENIQKFKTSNIAKVKLKEVAEVFRGKSILKKDTSLGNIRVLNISNIDNGEIDYSNMDTIGEDERKIKRYELISGDVVLSCRGTAIKSAVFKNKENIIIASANLIVIRPNSEMLGEYIKIFFESPIGIAIIKSFQRGTTIMNINHSDIMEMEIPFLPMSVQKEMIEEYHKEQNIYKKASNEAENRWKHIKNNIYDKLI